MAGRAGAIVTRSRSSLALTGVLLTGMVVLRGQQAPADSPRQGDPFRFRSSVELINVSATVSDANGRFVPDLQQDDFRVYEDGQPQTITHFSAERVPVSLGIVLDTSGSMAGEKIQSARTALDRFLFDLLDNDDEIFLYWFSDDPVLLQGWTNDRQLISRALGRITPNGATALYDAVAAAIPLAQSGSRPKKALLLISDGNDTSSRIDLRALQQRIRESEVLVYAVGIDGDTEDQLRRAQPAPPRAPLPPFPRPFPPIRGRGGWLPQVLGPRQPQFPRPMRGDDRVNAAALRDMTDDSGGRTEIIRDSRDLNPATTSIADELSRQYFMGYPANGKKDGRWHTIRVEVRDRPYRVRARRGYVAN
jgi:Ca-activated chloride channel family protein